VDIYHRQGGMDVRSTQARQAGRIIGDKRPSLQSMKSIPNIHC